MNTTYAFNGTDCRTHNNYYFVQPQGYNWVVLVVAQGRVLCSFCHSWIFEEEIIGNNLASYCLQPMNKLVVVELAMVLSAGDEEYGQ